MEIADGEELECRVGTKDQISKAEKEMRAEIEIINQCSAVQAGTWLIHLQNTYGKGRSGW
jgi:hypothetical protein